MIEELTKDPQDKFMSEVGSPTPKTDQQILLCFSKSKALVRSWTICFIIVAICCLFFWLHLSGKLMWTKQTIWYVGGVLMGCSTSVGVGFNIINILGLQTTYKCLGNCGDGKTIRFMHIVKTIRFWTFLDTLFIFVPPAKIFTTCMVKYHSLRLRPMIKALEKGYKIH